jgi:hypothetical protein
MGSTFLRHLRRWKFFFCVSEQHFLYMPAFRMTNGFYPSFSDGQGLTDDWITYKCPFLNAFILLSNEAVVHLCDVWHAVFHVLRGPKPQDAGTPSFKCPFSGKVGQQQKKLSINVSWSETIFIQLSTLAPDTRSRRSDSVEFHLLHSAAASLKRDQSWRGTTSCVMAKNARSFKSARHCLILIFEQ